MKNRIQLLPILFAILGLLCALTAVQAVHQSLDRPPRLVEVPDAASESVTMLMEGICRGEYETVTALLLGNPQLELDEPPTDPVGRLLWDAYMDSITYTLVGECYATEAGLAQDVHIEALDIASVMNSAGPLAQELFRLHRENSEDLSQIYDDEGNYREDFIQQTLMEATEQALAENSAVVSTELTLQLTLREGRWVISPDQALIRVICGGIAG